MRTLPPHPDVCAPEVSRPLLVMRPWTLPTGGKGSWREYRKWLLHYRANPRNVGYMMDRADEFLRQRAPGANIDVLAGPDLRDQVRDQDRPWVGRIWTEADADSLKEARYDTIVLAYPDAIGLGWGPTERLLLSLKAAHYVVINGRRRVFFWDRATRRELRLRRFMAKAWVFEMMLVPFVLAATVGFAVCDALTGRGDPGTFAE